MRIDNYGTEGDSLLSGVPVTVTFDMKTEKLSPGKPGAYLTISPVPDSDPTMGYSLQVSDITQEVALVDPEGVDSGSFKQDGKQCPEMWDSSLRGNYPAFEGNTFRPGGVEFFVSKQMGRAYIMYDAMKDPKADDPCNSVGVLSIIDLSTQVVTCELFPDGRPGSVLQRYSSEMELYDDLICKWLF